MQIVDNFLPQSSFDSLVTLADGGSIPWFYVNYIATEKDNKDFYFIHTVYEKFRPTSDLIDAINPILSILQPKAILRCRLLSYIGSDVLMEHAKHVDFDYSHKACILYLNTNDGFTRLENGEKVMSVANRALISDGGVAHNSTNCTNAKRRLVLTINYL